MGVELKRSFDLSELKQVGNGDERFVLDMINVFIRTTEEGLTKMEEAVNENNTEAIAHHAHKIAPPCRHMGATALLDLLKKIEDGARRSEPVDDLKPLITNARLEMNRVTKDLNTEIGTFE